MMSKIRKQFEEAVEKASALQKKRDESGLSDEETQQLDDWVSRAEALEPDVEAETEREDRLARLGSLSRSASSTPPPQSGNVRVVEPPKLTAGEYLSAYHGYVTTGDAASFLSRAERYHSRAASTSSDLDGIVPTDIVGPLIENYDSKRPVFASFTNLPMPGRGRTFDRPKITQHVSIGEQVIEGNALATQKMTVGSDPVTKRTFAGTLDLPRQVIDWTEPNSLDLVVGDFMKVYARSTEVAAITHLAGLATATSLWDPTDTASVVASYVNGAIAVSNALDDDVALRFWLSLDAAVALATPVGANERTLWSVVDEALGALGIPYGWTTSRRLPAATRVVGAPELVEAYEQTHGLLQAAKPSNLSTELAYSGYVAFHGIDAGFVSIEV